MAKDKEDDMKAFHDWITKTETEIDYWTDKLYRKALTKGKYKYCFSWLKKNEPDLSNSYNATAHESFKKVVVRNMFEDAYQALRDKQNNEVPKDD